MIFMMMTLCLCSCGARSSSVFENEENSLILESFEDRESLEVKYAKGFLIDRVNEDYYLITIGEQKILTVPDGKEIPDWVQEENGVVILKQPLNDIYVAATSIPDMIDCLGKLDQVSYTSTTYEDWALESMRSALESYSIEYVGKYRAPDYEVLLANGCALAIESTMIYHAPEVYEKLNDLGIPVLVDASSYEEDPLGRLEWIKVYGAILGCYEEAEEFFLKKEASVEACYQKQMDLEVRKTVAFFYISSNGSVVVRKPGDYITKMISLAGGEYVIHSVPEEENALSTMNMQMEAFYEEAIDADILIYNSTIDGEIHSFQELYEKSPLLKDFKAVKNGDVWCSGKNMFQESSSVAEMIADMSRLLDGEEDLQYFHRIEE